MKNTDTNNENKPIKDPKESGESAPIREPQDPGGGRTRLGS